MEHPSLRHFVNSGLFTVHSDAVQAKVGQSWLPAIYTDKGWATADGASLLLGVVEWRDGQSQKQSGEGDGGVQAGNLKQRQTGAGQRSTRQKPKASSRNSTK